MTYHPFDQVVRHLQACLSPMAATPEILPTDATGEHYPATKQECVLPTSCTRTEDECRHDKFNPRG